MTVSGTDATTIRNAIDARDPLPGTAGFAGSVDGLLVRDVLGRYPLFFERDDHRTWAHSQSRLDNPTRLPAGHVHDGDGTERIWTLPDPVSITDTATAVEQLRTSLTEATRAVETEGLAVAFSGGLDSALLAAWFDAPLYTVGFPGSHDITAARTAASLLDVELTVVELDHDAIAKAVPDVVAATGRTNAMDIQIALPLWVVANRVAADGIDRLALGQGADELFGGYAKVAKAPEDPRVSAETVQRARREVVETLPEQLERDIAAVRGAGVQPVTPLLHDDVVSVALSLPGELLVTDCGERKWALRLAARKWLPDRIAFREKKAVQYGSLVARELDRLARQSGYKRRMDDHVTKYIRHLCEDSSDREGQQRG